MSRKTFFSLMLIGFLVSACGGAPATQQAAPPNEAPGSVATEAPAATEAAAEAPQHIPNVVESEFNSISAEKASSVDVSLYQSLSAFEPIAVDETALAVSLSSVDPTKIPVAPNQPVATYQLGQVRTFWVHNNSTLQFNLITAKLMLISDHAYFWQDVAVNQEVTAEDWSFAGGSFDRSYERIRTVFGEEESLGLDGDSRLFIVHSDSAGGVGGYFSEIDQLPAVVEAHSNEGQYFFISNTNTSGVASAYYKEVLAHEFQHMIQKNMDPNEEGWLNEGLSMLAQQVAGMQGDTWVEEYLIQPDQSLWYWGKNSADYGQSYLYLDYLYEQLGVDFIKALSANPVNGMLSIDQTLKKFKSKRDADALYTDAISAAFFNDPALQNNQLAYQIPDLPIIFPTHEFGSLPSLYQGTVQQYGGVDILEFNGDGKATLNFIGDQTVRLIPTNAHSGDRFWWSNRNDSTFATLTRRVDLTSTLTATLKYWAWYDIEENWDYAYLLVSTDNGNHWTPLPATSSRETDPNAQNHGYGVSGISGNGNESIWIQETANLNAYAGKQILLRFAMQNNRSVNNFGFAVDDLSIAEINWTDNVEAGDKDWTSAGFLPVHNRVPQVWSVRVVEKNKDDSIKVHDLKIKNGTANLETDFNNLDQLIVFIIGQTHYTTLPASYQVEVSPR